MIDLQTLLPGVALLQNEPLAKYTAARLGGAADWLYIARTDAAELSRVVLAAWRAEVPVRILGGGANVLVSDQGVRGLVVIDRCADLQVQGTVVIASGGTSLTVMAHKLQSLGLSGFEWAVSVPGTIGGAAVNNAGAHKRDMASNVRRVCIVDAEQGEQVLLPTDLAYGYRTSSLKARTDRRFLVLSAEMEFERDDRNAIQARMDENIAYRKRTQPPGASLGSIFKNPPGDYAGRLIESCGLKGFQIGGAQVSPVHANFFINTAAARSVTRSAGSDATASDYAALIHHVRRVVFEQTGIRLEPEIEWVGEWFDDGAPDSSDERFMI